MGIFCVKGLGVGQLRLERALGIHRAAEAQKKSAFREDGGIGGVAGPDHGPFSPVGGGPAQGFFQPFRDGGTARDVGHALRDAQIELQSGNSGAFAVDLKGYHAAKLDIGSRGYHRQLHGSPGSQNTQRQQRKHQSDANQQTQGAFHMSIHKYYSFLQWKPIQSITSLLYN